MTHAAAVSAAPQVPRRRPSAPAAVERAGAASGVVGALLLVGLWVIPLARTIGRGDRPPPEEGS